MSPSLLNYYEAIEQASADMLHAARSGDWDQVVKLEGACVLLISQLKQASRDAPLQGDAEVRHLAEPWLPDLHRLLQGKANKSGSTLH